MKKIEDLKVKIFADGADKSSMIQMAGKSFIKGLTTNPTLMKKAGVNDYKSFAKDVLSEIKDKPISFEVFDDDFDGMERQAMEIAAWADNVFVKVPITNTRREPSFDLVGKLTSRNVKVNVTAIMTEGQIQGVVDCLQPTVPSFLSVFAGRIADTGVDPLPLMKHALEVLEKIPAAELIWASPREILNLHQADSIGCHAITLTADLLGKLHLTGYNLDNYSLDTVKMFHQDALNAGYKL
jgi:transaldolase